MEERKKKEEKARRRLRVIRQETKEKVFLSPHLEVGSHGNKKRTKE
jgi:hypothetical protein